MRVGLRKTKSRRAADALRAYPMMLGLMLAMVLITACGQSGSGESAADASRLSSDDAFIAAQTGPELPLNPNPPGQPVRLVFIHHGVGDHWLDDFGGRLGLILADDNYYVSDTDYGWLPPDADAGAGAIGDHTDIGQWYSWFAGPNHSHYMSALYANGDRLSYIPYSRMPVSPDPGGENQVVMFMSEFENSAIKGSPEEPATPTFRDNPLRGQGSGSDYLTVANAKGIYQDMLVYFQTRPDKLFVVITAPPLAPLMTTPEEAANARAFNIWLTRDWLKGYPYRNVAVFDFYNVLTSNGGWPGLSDVNLPTGNHHRHSIGGVEYTTGQGSDFSAYATGEEDSLPSSAGLEKASAEFVPLLNIAYHRWQGR